MRILITYQYFLPAYKAGGPVQSIKNTASLLSGLMDTHTYILCSNGDLDGSISNVQTDTWVEYADRVKVYYNAIAGKKKDILNIISGVNPDVIFINGLYSIPYTIYPLLYKGTARKILSVRGMLHPGALSQKSLKKKLFLTAFKMLGLHKSCEFHATTEEETQYIKNEFGVDKKVWMVPNLPNVLEYQQPIEKQDSSVKLVSVSLISPMKNILLVLQSLMRCTTNITYDIYGPVKDSEYWNDCLAVMSQLPENITVGYKGEVEPLLIQDTLKDYHYFILPSKSENFGHAIYEALSAGKPVITSYNTPWNGLENATAGYNVDPEHTSVFVQLLDKLTAITNEQYSVSTKAAKEYISQQYDLDNIKGLYKKMFSVQDELNETTNDDFRN